MPTLGRVDLHPPEDLESGMARLSSYNQAYAHLRGMGLVPNPKPSGFNGDLPQLTHLSDDQLGDLLGACAAWTDFVDEKLGEAQAEAASAKASHEFAESRLRIELRAREDRKLTTQDKNDAIITDPRIVQAKARLLYADTVVTLTRAFRDKAQRAWDTVSRRITQRGQEVNRGTRTGNVANIPARFGGGR